MVKTNVHKLLFEDDLWRIVHLDIEYHSLYEKRVNTEKIIKALLVDDESLNDIELLETMVAIQDLQDYIHFTYSAELKKIEDSKDQEDAQEEYEDKKGTKNIQSMLFSKRIRENVLYDAVKGFGISAKEFGENVQDQSTKNYEVPYRIHATDDPYESPEDMDW